MGMDSRLERVELTSFFSGVDYTGDFAIVQSSNFTTLFVLSREREVEDEVLDVSFVFCFFFGLGMCM
jgi:hypothetical protein